jgi:alkylation response protein AidB-like acyl-CoA dehydrogenase
VVVIARFADWGIALVRTDGAPRHKGISMLAIPMQSRGVEVRPLRQITGESEFNEVFLDEVEVPVENLIGPENEGWAVANTTLVNERGATFVWKEQVLHAVAFDLLVQACARAGRLDDPVVRERLARSWIDVEIFRLHNERTRARVASGEGIGAQSSIVKLFWAGMSQRLYETVGVLGPAAPHATTGRTRSRALALGCFRQRQLHHGRHRQRSSATSSARTDPRPARTGRKRWR